MLINIPYKHDELPDLKSKLAEEVASALYEEWVYWRDARSVLEKEIWRACDDAYMCYRKLPKNPGMPFLDTSDLGETDIWDGINFLARSLALSLMPRDEMYLQAISQNAEDQEVQNRIRDFVTSLARKADLRGQYAKHLKQTLIRGTGAVSLDWQKVIRRKRRSLADSMLEQVNRSVEGDYQPIKRIKREVVDEIVYNGPIIRPLDMMDVYLEPTADLSCDADIPVAVMTYKSLAELETAQDEYGEKMYGNLEGLVELSPQELTTLNPERSRSLQVLGINPSESGKSLAGVIPVLVFHRQHFRLGSNSWVDTYWHIALSNTFKQYKLIRVNENPVDEGHKMIFFDSYQDWIGSAYGIGAVEKSLSAYNKKNVMAALGLNAAALQVFPPMAVITDLLLDDREADVSPGGYNPIKFKPAIGTNFMAPVPINPGNAGAMAMQSQQYYGQQISGQMGAYGAIMQDPTKSVSRAKTATQINTENTSGSVGRDDLLEQITTRSLEPLVQAMYDCSVQYLAGEDIDFERTINGSASYVKISPDELRQKRRIIVTGWHGLQNKQQEVAEMKEALSVIVQAAAYLPNSAAYIQKVVTKMLGRLGISDLEKLGLPPEQLASAPEAMTGVPPQVPGGLDAQA